MGRFETTVEFYRYREPYPAEFFETVAERLRLTHDARLLDVGCGPGLLAIGFARFVGSCTGIDREPEMLRTARKAADHAGVSIDFIHAGIEDFQADANSFDFVTIGRALHWLPRQETLAVFEKVLAPAARIAVCGSFANGSDVNAWNKEYKRLRDAWSPEDESRYRVDLDKWFAPSRFRKIEEIVVDHRHRVSVDDLVKRMLSYSTVSPAVIGDKRPEFEAEIRAVLEPFACNGIVEEELSVKATVFE